MPATQRVPVRAAVQLLALTALSIGAASVGCSSPVTPLQTVAWEVESTWPSAGEARADTDVLVDGGVWYWTHGKKSADGFGVTMVVLDDEPGVNAIWDRLNHVDSAELSKPNLLYFDQEGEDWEDWPVIGFGYTVHYVPCLFPTIDGVEPGQWFVHEAGYHHVPLGDGGMTLADDESLRNDAASTSVDAEGCEPVYSEDLSTRIDRVRHGRAWVIHVWLDPEGGPPVVAVTDPWERWIDDPDRVQIDDAAFFYPSFDTCDCVVPEPPQRGCG